MKKLLKSALSIILTIATLTTLFTLPASAASVKLNKTSITIAVTENYTLTLKNNEETIKWSTSDKSIATVTSKGKVKGIAKGTATITAKVGSNSYKCKVTVKTYRIVKTDATMFVGEEQTLKVKGNITSKTVVLWGSSDKDIATVEDGVVTAVGEGKVKISATIGKVKYSTTITVEEPVDTDDEELAVDETATFSLAKANDEVKVQKVKFILTENGKVVNYISPCFDTVSSIPLEIQITPSDYTEHLNWVSTDPNVISVNENGEMTIEGVGCAIIYVFTDNKVERGYIRIEMRANQFDYDTMDLMPDEHKIDFDALFNGEGLKFKDEDE